MSEKTFLFKNENHTLGYLIQCELLNDPLVTFAGYINEHPLEKEIKIKVSSGDPMKSFTDAVDRTISKLEHLEMEYKKCYGLCQKS